MSKKSKETPKKDKKKDKSLEGKYPLKLLYSDELKAIISTNLIHVKNSFF